MSSPFGDTNFGGRTAVSLLDDEPGDSPKAKLTNRIRQGEFTGMDDAQLAKHQAGVKRKKKKKKTRAGQSILAARSAQSIPDQAERERIQTEIEKERIKEDSVAVVAVSDKDQDLFTNNLDAATKALRNFMLVELAPKQLGVKSALDVTLQELNLLLEGGVAANAISAYDRVNAEVAMIAVTLKVCELYNIPKTTTRKIIDAKIAALIPPPGHGPSTGDFLDKLKASGSRRKKG